MISHIGGSTRRKANLSIIGLGVHTLRSTFLSTAQKAGVAEPAAQWMLGHGSDKYGYSRLDREFVESENVENVEST